MKSSNPVPNGLPPSRSTALLSLPRPVTKPIVPGRNKPLRGHKCYFDAGVIQAVYQLSLLPRYVTSEVDTQMPGRTWLPAPSNGPLGADWQLRQRNDTPLNLSDSIHIVYIPATSEPRIDSLLNRPPG